MRALVPPDRAGEFYAGITESTKAASKPYLKLADRAFAAGTQTRFFGGGPMSPSVPAIFQTVAHEVGHAVETKEYREAYDKYVEESAKYEATQQDVAEEERVTRAKVAPRGRKAAKKFWDEQSERYRINNERKAQAKRLVDCSGMAEGVDESYHFHTASSHTATAKVH